MKTQAERYNRGKPQYSLICLKSLQPMIRVLEFGAEKYARDNWKQGLDKNHIVDSLLRHVAALLAGETLDVESGLSHIGHIQANAMFLGHKDEGDDKWL